MRYRLRLVCLGLLIALAALMVGYPYFENTRGGAFLAGVTSLLTLTGAVCEAIGGGLKCPPVQRTAPGSDGENDPSQLAA